MDTERSRETDTERTGLSGRQGRSGSGTTINWETIGQVAGQRTSFQSQDYEFVDNDLQEGFSVVYYRLKQVDYNGESQYSAIRTLTVDHRETGQSTTFVIYPNPSSGQFIHFNKKELHRVWSMTGKVLKPFSNTSAIDVSDLATGTYIIENADGNTQLYIRN